MGNIAVHPRDDAREDSDEEPASTSRPSRSTPKPTSFLRSVHSRSILGRANLHHALESLASSREGKSRKKIHLGQIESILNLKKLIRGNGRVSEKYAKKLSALAHSFGDSDDPELSKKTTHFIRLGGVAAALEALATMRRKLAASRLDGSARPTSTAPRRDAVLAGQAAGSLLVLLRECAYTVHPVARAPRGALADAGVVAAAFALLRYPETADPARFFLDELFSLGVRPPSLGTLRWRGVDVTNVVAGLGPSALMQLSSTLAGLTFNADIQEPARVQSARSMLAYCRGSASHTGERVALRRHGDGASVVAEDLPEQADVAGAPRGAPPVRYVPSLGPELDENLHELISAGDGLLVYRLLQLATLPAPAGRAAAVLERFSTASESIQEMVLGGDEALGGGHGHAHGHAHGVAPGDDGDDGGDDGGEDADSDDEDEDAAGGDGADEDLGDGGLIDNATLGALLDGGVEGRDAPGVAAASPTEDDDTDDEPVGLRPPTAPATAGPPVASAVIRGAALLQAGPPPPVVAAPRVAAAPSSVPPTRSELMVLLMAEVQLQLPHGEGQTAPAKPSRDLLVDQLRALRGRAGNVPEPSQLPASDPPRDEAAFVGPLKLEEVVSAGRGATPSSALRFPGPLAAPRYAPSLDEGAEAAVVSPVHALRLAALAGAVGSERTAAVEDELAVGYDAASCGEAEALLLESPSARDSAAALANFPRNALAGLRLRPSVRSDWGLVSRLTGTGVSSASPFPSSAPLPPLGASDAGLLQQLLVERALGGALGLPPAALPCDASSWAFAGSAVKVSPSGEPSMRPRFAWSHFELPRSCYDVVAPRAVLVFEKAALEREQQADGCSSLESRLEDASRSAPLLSALTAALASQTAAQVSPSAIFSESDIVDPRSAAVRGAGRHVISFSRTDQPPAAVSGVRPAAASVAPLGDFSVTPQTARVALLLQKLPSLQPNAIFLVSTLLAGSRRRQLQDYIAGCGFLPGLTRLVHGVDWLYDPGTSPPPRIHGPTCECRPETENVIPLLRAIHSLVDRECESAVQRWLPRRRLLTASELIAAYRAYGPPGSVLVAADGRSFVDESALLLDVVRPSLLRPQASADVDTRGSDVASEAAWRTAGVVAYTAAPRRLVVIDSVLCGRNAAHLKPLDVEDIDSDDDDDSSLRRGRVGLSRGAPYPAEALPAVLARAPPTLAELACDDACSSSSHAQPETKSTKSLRRAVRRAIAAGLHVSPELASRAHPRGIISLLTALLVVLPTRSPFRGWFGSILCAFLRSAPLPVRRWLNAHGIVTAMARTLVERHAAREVPGLELKLPSSSEGVADGPAAGHAADSSSTTSSSSGECEGDDESPSYERQTCFDVLSECLRGDVAAAGELWAAGDRFCAASLAAAGWSASTIATESSLHASLLLRLACDHLTDSNMLWRSLFTCEDWCYGLCGVQVAQSFWGAASTTLPGSLSSPPGSWEALVAESATIVAGAPIPSAARPAAALYASMNASALAHPLFSFLRQYRVPLLYALMGAVTVDTVGHDNLCVLNTALLVFVSAHRHGALPALVAQLRAYQGAVFEDVSAGGASAASNVVSASASFPRGPLRLPSLKEPLATGWIVKSRQGEGGAAAAQPPAGIAARPPPALDAESQSAALVAAPDETAPTSTGHSEVRRDAVTAVIVHGWEDRFSALEATVEAHATELARVRAALAASEANRERMAAQLAAAAAALSSERAPLPAPPAAEPLSSAEIAPGADGGVPAAASSPPNPAAVRPPMDVLLGFSHLLAFWLEYNSLRERDRRAMRSMTQYNYAETRVVVRGLLGLPVDRPLSAARVPPGIIAEPPAAFAGLREHSTAHAQGVYPPLAAAGAASAERLRLACAEFDAYASRAHIGGALGDGAPAVSLNRDWLAPPPRFVRAVRETSGAEAPPENAGFREEDVCAAYWQAACLLLPTPRRE